jgi:hypothetical protein
MALCCEGYSYGRGINKTHDARKAMNLQQGSSAADVSYHAVSEQTGLLLFVSGPTYFALTGRPRRAKADLATNSSVKQYGFIKK